MYADDSGSVSGMHRITISHNIHTIERETRD